MLCYSIMGNSAFLTRREGTVRSPYVCVVVVTFVVVYVAVK